MALLLPARYPRTEDSYTLDGLFVQDPGGLEDHKDHNHGKSDHVPERPAARDEGGGQGRPFR